MKTAPETNGLLWPKLTTGNLIRRYKRFLADVKLRNGRVVTAHCPNSGSMLTCSEPGRTVYLSSHNKPTRKLRYTWEMIRMPGSLVGVNTLVPNRLVRQGVEEGFIRELASYDVVRPEVKYGLSSRVDLLLENDRERCFVEIKNCTLIDGEVARFPDAVTTRGLKHLVELQNQVLEGDRAVIFFLIQRMDAKRFEPADGIDPAYGNELRKAVDAGVEALAYDVHLDSERIRLNRRVECFL